MVICWDPFWRPRAGSVSTGSVGRSHFSLLPFALGRAAGAQASAFRFFKSQVVVRWEMKDVGQNHTFSHVFLWGKN